MINKLAKAIKNNFNADILVVTDNPWSGKTFYLNELSGKIKTFTGNDLSDDCIRIVDDIDLELRGHNKKINERIFFNDDNLIICSVGISITHLLPYNTRNRRVLFFHNVNQFKRELDGFIDKFIYSENEAIKIKESCDFINQETKKRRL